MHMKINI